MSARELAAQVANRKADKLRGLEPPARRRLTGASLIDWSTAPTAIEVAQANPGLCAVLENAALLYANGQARPARELLEQGVQTDPRHEAVAARVARAVRPAAARERPRGRSISSPMQYVVQFERSAPGVGRAREAAGRRQAAAAGGYIALTGKLSAAARRSSRA